LFEQIAPTSKARYNSPDLSLSPLSLLTSLSLLSLAQCMSLIGTECTIDIQLATPKARDLLAHKLKLFIDSWKGREEDSFA
jgi:hypothetical protein